MSGDVLRLLRPTQWVKNLLVFAALIFSRHLFDPGALAISLVAFASFCALASAVYVGNDLHDAENDRRHPEKRERPIASGRIPPATAMALGGASLACGLAVALGLGREFTIIAIAYVLLQLAYTFVLKDVVILDAMSIATGFVLRAVGG
ncbi:MAG: UbiA prenyltransferase family protein, partial [Candidatus Binatia bacterium]